MKKKKQRSKLEDYAAKPVLVFSGSLLVLSVALNNIGFKEVVDAYAKSIVHKLEDNKSCNIELNSRLELVESLAHKGGKHATQETE